MAFPAHIPSPAIFQSREEPPASSTTLKRRPDHTSLQRRQKIKVTRACDICKTKKSKCSGHQPCTSCKRRGLLCQYAAAYSRGKPPLPRRVEQGSDSTLGQHVANSELYSAQESVGIVSDLSTASKQRQPRDQALAMLQSTASHLSEPMEDVPSGRASPGLEVAGQFSDPTSGLSFLHRAWRRISNNENSQVVLSQVEAHCEENQLLNCAGDKPLRSSGQRAVLPSLSKGKILLELYFDVCIATYRILHKPSVVEWCAAVLTNEQLDRALPMGVGNAKAAVVLAVLAVASFHEEKTRDDSSHSSGLSNDAQHELQADELFCEAARLSDEERGFPQLESAQSRLIQVLYLLISCRFNQAWYTFGHALQIISALGLHRRDGRKRKTLDSRDYIQEQCRRRTFWVAYTLDKYLGVIFGRPRHYHDDDIDQDFPDSINDEDMLPSGPRSNGIADCDCHIDSLIWHARLAQIAERISREVYSIKPIPDDSRLAASHQLGTDLRQWKASLPPLLGSINPNSLIPSFRRQATALKLSYYHAVMLTHRPFLLRNTFCNDDSLRTLATESLVECISAARSVLEVVDSIAREGRLFHAFWWTHYVCFCALAIIYVWTIQDRSNRPSFIEQHEILDQAERCLSHLAQATATNSPSRKYSIILQELRVEAMKKTARDLQEQSTVRRAQTTDQAVNHNMMDSVSTSPVEKMQQSWPQLLGNVSPVDSTMPGLQNFLDEWQTTNWLHLDSSAFGLMRDYDDSSLNWV